MTDTNTPEDSGDKSPEERTLADWMRITQRAFMRQVAEEIGNEGIDMRVAMAAKFHGHPSPDADKLGAVIKAVQERATASVSADDLAATLRTLETIARELGWDENQASGPGRGFGPGFGQGGRGPWGGWGGFDPRRGFGPGRGHRGHRGHGDGGHDDGGEHPKRERAYERGFEAGFDAAQRRNPAA